MKCKYFDCGWCCAPIDVVTSASSCGSCIYPEHCPEITNQLPEVMSSGTAIISDENGVPTKVHLSDKEKLTEMTKKMDSVESIEAQIKMLQSKLEFYKELEKTKTPVEEAYKDWWGQYPETGTWDGFDEKRWQGFQAGYEFAYAISTAKEVMEKVQEEPKDNEWKSVALRFGEELVSIGPCGYYEFTAEEWFDWVVNTYEKICDDTVKLLKKENLKKAQERGERVHKKMEETIKIHDGYGGVDYKPTPQTPEQIADGLKKAFHEAVKQGIIQEVDKVSDVFMNEMVAELKGQTLYDLIADWWDEIFTNGNPSGQNIETLVETVEKWLPKEQSANSQNAYVECTVEGFNDCLQKIKSKLR